MLQSWSMLQHMYTKMSIHESSALLTAFTSLWSEWWMTGVERQAAGCQRGRGVGTGGERSPLACWYCAGTPASSPAAPERTFRKSVNTSHETKLTIKGERDSVRQNTWTKVGGSSSDIWAVGMSSLSQGGFFLCRLLVLSRRGSAMFSVPPQACQLHWERRRKCRYHESQWITCNFSNSR